MLPFGFLVWFQNRRAKFRKTERVVQPNSSTTTTTTPTETSGVITSTLSTTNITPPTTCMNHTDVNLPSQTRIQHLTLNNNNSIFNEKSQFIPSTSDQYTPMHHLKNTQNEGMLHRNIDSQFQHYQPSEHLEDEGIYSQETIETYNKVKGNELINTAEKHYPPLTDPFCSMISKPPNVFQSIPINPDNKLYTDWSNSASDCFREISYTDNHSSGIHPLYKLSQACRQVDRLLIGEAQEVVNTFNSNNKKSSGKQQKLIERKSRNCQY
ncbi:unnamed protein product [Trichobilharzia szidati]|nr:unnamed protein product [Trichobilharzia szidati]